MTGHRHGLRRPRCPACALVGRTLTRASDGAYVDVDVVPAIDAGVPLGHPINRMIFQNAAQLVHDAATGLTVRVHVISTGNVWDWS